MFFFAFFGVQDREKELGTYNNIICPSCGRLSRYDIYKNYTYFHVFLIPTFKWNTRYYARAACCGALFELDPAVGREFERNPNTEIRPENLRRVQSYMPFKYCQNCRANVPIEFSFCPYCGGKL